MLLKAHAGKKAPTSPSKSTRAQTDAAEADKQDNKKDGRVQQTEPPTENSPLSTIVHGVKWSLSSNGRTDDGSDESIIASKLVQSAVCRGIGEMIPIYPISFQAALKDGKEAKMFFFSRSFTVPRTVLYLAAGPSELVNMTFLVAEG